MINGSKYRRISRETEVQVADFLMAIAEGERDVEINRQILSESSNFNQYQIFDFLLNYPNGPQINKYEIDIRDLANYLNEHQINFTENELKLLILFYDHNYSQGLTYAEFINLITSEKSLCYGEKNQKEIIAERNNAYQPLNRRFPIEPNVNYLLLRLLEKEIKFARKIIGLLSDFNKDDFNQLVMYNKIGKGYFITSDRLKYFLDRNYVHYSETDLRNIFKRIDFNADDKIDLCEFHLLFSFPQCHPCYANSPCKCGLDLSDPCLYEIVCPSCAQVHEKILPPVKVKDSDDEEDEDEPEKQHIGALHDSVNKLFTISGGMQNRTYPVGGYTNTQTFNQNFLRTAQPGMNFASSQNTVGTNTKVNDIKPDEDEKINENLYIRKGAKRKYGPQVVFCDKCREPNCQCDKINQTIPDEPVQFSSSSNLEIQEALNNYPQTSLSQGNKPFNPIEYEEGQLIDYFKYAMQAECQIEELKVQLACRSDFNCEDAFRIFEFEGNGTLTNKDMQNGLHLLGIDSTDNDLLFLLKRYTKKNGEINYLEFCDILVPYEKSYRKIVESRSPHSCCISQNPNVFTSPTRLCIRQVFNAIFQQEKKLNLKKNDYTTLKLKLDQVLNSLFTLNDGKFGEDGLAVLLHKYQIFISSQGCDLLFRRIDHKNCGQVGYDDLSDELNPMQ